MNIKIKLLSGKNSKPFRTTKNGESVEQILAREETEKVEKINNYFDIQSKSYYLFRFKMKFK
jgi:hypothetical protein